MSPDTHNDIDNPHSHPLKSSRLSERVLKPSTCLLCRLNYGGKAKSVEVGRAPGYAVESVITVNGAR